MQNFSYENEFCMQFHFYVNQSHFHENGFTLRLTLKQRHNGTWRWPIVIILNTNGTKKLTGVPTVKLVVCEHTFFTPC